MCHLKEEKFSSLYMLDDAEESIRPTLIVLVNKQKFRVLFNTGVGDLLCHLLSSTILRKNLTTGMECTASTSKLKN